MRGAEIDVRGQMEADLRTTWKWLALAVSDPVKLVLDSPGGHAVPGSLVAPPVHGDIHSLFVGV